jgi:outer membrane protein OmpA-like peptidoglycan-associated protein
LILALFVASVAGNASADEPRWHLNAGGAHAVGDPQASEYGFGAIGQLALELPLAHALGIQLEAGALWLSKGDRPTDPSLADHGAGTAGTAFGGVRLHPSAVAGPWLDLNGGYVMTGSASRFGFDTHVGYDWRVGGGRVDVGPFAGYLHIVQPDDSLRPEDAHVVMIGIHVALGANVPIKVRTDRDHDGVFDDEDACPDVPGVRTTDPKTNGCPPAPPPRGDRDKDGIFDDEDACPDEPGIRTDDPKTNGCPRKDRDKDGVFDDEDACPDEPGIRTQDPKTNGCPRRDKDGDGVFDDEDACPDVPGVRTTDPKTNGCPPASDSVHVEKDHIVLDDAIYFETNIARVRHYSWPLIEKLAKFLNANPDISEVSIEGHTDEVGSEGYNKILSKARADAVKRMLVQYGVDGSRLTTVGWGKERPVDLGHDETAHKRNRRVEFIITRVRSGSGTSAPTQPSGGP